MGGPQANRTPTDNSSGNVRLPRSCRRCGELGHYASTCDRATIDVAAVIARLFAAARARRDADDRAARVALGEMRAQLQALWRNEKRQAARELLLEHQALVGSMALAGTQLDREMGRTA